MNLKTFSCDKCGEVITGYIAERHQIDLPWTEYHLRKTGKDVVTANRTQFDICPRCMLDLKVWITGEELERIDE